MGTLPPVRHSGTATVRDAVRVTVVPRTGVHQRFPLRSAIATAMIGREMSRRLALGALLLYAAALAAITLGTSPEPALQWTTDTLQRLDMLRDVSENAVERGANVLLFVPAGLLLCAALPRTPRALVWTLCVLASAGAELAQLVLPGRQTTVVDVVMNATGAALGILLHTALSGRRAPVG
jgi:VanZ family protein